MKDSVPLIILSVTTTGALGAIEVSVAFINHKFAIHSL
jgi:hypothetical protein